MRPPVLPIPVPITPSSSSSSPKPPSSSVPPKPSTQVTASASTTSKKAASSSASSITPPKPTTSALQPSVSATPPAPTGCYPASNLAIPTTPATASSLSSWWCKHETEYAFMGFSYDQTPCQSASELDKEFGIMKHNYNARYVRLYGTCDDPAYMPRLIAAAAKANLGVYALIWFGFDGDSKWKTRMANLVKTIQTNHQAPYVIRAVAVGSEPLFDHVLSPDDLAAQVVGLRSKLAVYGIETTISEMPWGFQSNGDAPQIFKAIDMVQANVLPFFSPEASWGGEAWGNVAWSISYFQQFAPGKPIRLTQTGWPSNVNVWKANNAVAQASIASEAAYFDLLDEKCNVLKSWGVGWFSQIYTDAQLDGWGILDNNNQPKFDFSPRTHC